MSEYEGRNIKWLNASSPLLDGDRIYVGGGGKNQSFLCFDKSTGKELWKTGDEEITHATPSLTEIDGKKQVIFFVQSGLVSIDPTSGNELWRQKYDFAVSTAASPITDGNLVYCSAGYGVGAGLYKVTDNSTTERVWRKPSKLMNHWSTPIVHDGHLYGIFEFKKYGKAPLNCVELKTGKIKWSKRGFGPGNCILVGDTLVVLSDAGEVVFVKAQTSEYEELAREDVLEGKCWSTPAYADGRIYVRSTEEGACIEVGN
jgi:outer membrane protein assembly factor BamB